MPVGIAKPLWQGKRKRYSRRKQNRQFYVPGKRRMNTFAITFRGPIWHSTNIQCSHNSSLKTPPKYNISNIFLKLRYLFSNWDLQSFRTLRQQTVTKGQYLANYNLMLTIICRRPQSIHSMNHHITTNATMYLMYTAPPPPPTTTTTTTKKTPKIQNKVNTMLCLHCL